MKMIVPAIAVGLALASAASAQPGAPQPRAGGVYAEFDVRGAGSWTQRLVLCDTTAFLASQPNLNADRMWVRRDDRPPQLLLPPYFVGAGRWYKEGYERLFWRLRRQHQVSADELYRTQDTIGRRFVDAYRRANPYTGGGVDLRFLDAQDRYCRTTARGEGEIIS